MFSKIILQDGPVKEHGVNGDQIDDIIEWCRDALVGFNQQPYTNGHNTLAIQRLDEALEELHLRTVSREARGVEGTSQP